MCKSLAEGGERCASSLASERRNKDRARYGAKRAIGKGVRAPKASAFVWALSSKLDPNVNLGENGLLEKIKMTRADLGNVLAESSGVVLENLGDKTIASIERDVCAIGAEVEARAFVLAGLTQKDLVDTEKSWRKRLSKARRASKPKLTELNENLEALNRSLAELNASASKKESHDKEITVIEGEIKQVKAELKTLRQGILPLEYGLDEETMMVLRKISAGYQQALSEVRPFGFTGEIKDVAEISDETIPFSDLDRRGIDIVSTMLREAGRHYPQEWFDEGSEKNRLAVGRDSSDSPRERYVPEVLVKGNQVYSAVYLSPDSIQECAVHELGHYMEHVHPEVGVLSHAFLLRRTTDGQGVRAELEPYLLDNEAVKAELVRPDHFVDRYIGKHLGPGDSELKVIGRCDDPIRLHDGSLIPRFHECFSTGVGLLYENTPALFGLGKQNGTLDKGGDIDMRQWILGVLASA